MSGLGERSPRSLFCCAGDSPRRRTDAGERKRGLGEKERSVSWAFDDDAIWRPTTSAFDLFSLPLLSAALGLCGSAAK